MRLEVSALLVDDDENVLRIHERYLNRLGYRVTPARNGREALALLRGNPHRFQLLITDVQMPFMDGVELVSKVRQEQCNMPIVVISGDVHEARLDELKRYKVVVAPKPLSFGRFCILVSNVEVALREGGSSDFHACAVC